MHRRQLVNIIGIAALICLLFSVPLLWKSIYWIHVLILTMINVLLAVSLRALTRTGQVSIGTAGFMLLGAYSSALLAMKLGLSFWITLPLGGLLAAVVALIVGYPFLKAKGIYFAILTVMLAEVCRLITWYWTSMTGGSAGLTNIPPPNPISILGITILSFNTKIASYYLILVIIIISLVILYRIERSWLGLMWSAINEADNLAQAVGINIMGHKMLIFCVSSFFMGIAGALYGHYMGTLTPFGTPGSPFGFMASIYALIYVVLGGEARFAGPIIGAVLLTIIPELARGLREYMPLIFGGLLIIVVFFMPEGIVGLSAPLSRWYGRVVRRLTKKPRRVEDKVV
jgi:branched-chain amino acid transport system permease protein